MLSLPEKPNKEENPEIAVWREFDRQVFFLAPAAQGHGRVRGHLCKPFVGGIRADAHL